MKHHAKLISRNLSPNQLWWEQSCEILWIIWSLNEDNEYAVFTFLLLGSRPWKPGKEGETVGQMGHAGNPPSEPGPLTRPTPSSALKFTNIYSLNESFPEILCSLALHMCKAHTLSFSLLSPPAAKNIGMSLMNCNVLLTAMRIACFNKGYNLIIQTV